TVAARPRVSALFMYATHFRIPPRAALALPNQSWLNAAPPIALRCALQSAPGASPDGGVTVARLPLRNAPAGPRAANDAAAASAKNATAANANDLTALLKAAPFESDCDLRLRLAFCHRSPCAGMASLVWRSEGPACVGLRAQLQVGALALIERQWRFADSRDDKATIVAVAWCDRLPHLGRRAQTLDQCIAPRAGHEQEMGGRALFESRFRTADRGIRISR